MNNPAADCPSPMRPLPDEATARLCARRAEILRTRAWRLLAMSSGKGCIQVKLNRS
jgi:hypothetical protein